MARNAKEEALFQAVREFLKVLEELNRVLDATLPPEMLEALDRHAERLRTLNEAKGKTQEVSRE